MRYRSNWRHLVTLAIVAVLAMVSCGRSTTTPTAPTPTPIALPVPSADPPPSPPTPSPVPTGGSQLTVTVVAPFRVGVPGQIAYRVADTETLARLSVRLSSPGGAVARSEISPASASGTFSPTFQMPGTYYLTVTATTRTGSVLEGTVAVHVEP